MKPGTLLPFVLLLPACRKPPEAPAKLEQLAGYLFEHMGDEDTEALGVGVTNLDIWLDANIEETLEGYTIENPAGGVLNGLDGKDRKTEGLVGAAVASELDAGVKPVVKILVKADFTKVYEDTYSRYDRTYKSDVGCFTASECEDLAFRVETESLYPMGLEVDADFNAEYRWVEFERGEDGEPLTAMVQRTWLIKPAEVSANWLSVPAQYFLSVNIPKNGGTRRLQATWILAEMGDSPVPEATALNLVVGSMQDSDEALNAYMNK
jgi:hypothetical protein